MLNFLFFNTCLFKKIFATGWVQAYENWFYGLPMRKIVPDIHSSKFKILPFNSICFPRCKSRVNLSLRNELR